jgi:hypothetical protein
MLEAHLGQSVAVHRLWNSDVWNRTGSVNIFRIRLILHSEAKAKELQLYTQLDE